MANFNRDNKLGKRSPGRSYDDNSTRFSRGDSPRSGGRDSDRFVNRNPERSFEKRMFTAICAKCGERCEIPFRPRENKPVYCSTCFRNSDNYHSKPTAPSNNEFEQIHKKLDKIMKALDI